MTALVLPADAHRCQYRVLYGDTDSGGVVYYANYLRFFERGRTEFMRDRLVAYRLLENEGMILPVVESWCRYKAPARYDDLLLLETAMVEAREVSCRFHYRVSRAGDPRQLAMGYTVHAVVDRQGKLSRFPAELLARLKGLVTPV
ncbi:MAG: thioesterase family protein [Thermodesulfobacteriota bacterium]